MNQALRQLALTVADSLPGLPLMGYNDMSLVWGGMFDIGPPYGQFWNMPHCSHRLGRGVDFRTKTLDLGPTHSNDLARKLRRLIRKAGFAEPHKEGHHWHLNYTFPTGN